MTKSNPDKDTIELWVVFDTNALYSERPNLVVNKNIVRSVANAKHVPHVKVRWFVPEVVKLERQYQLFSDAMEWSIKADNLNRFFGGEAQSNPDLIRQRAGDLTEAKFAELNIETHKLDMSRVNWNRMLHDAVNRNPPFSPSDDEKGFRDALAIESFTQLLEQCSGGGQRHKIIMISQDKAVCAAIKTLIKGNDAALPPQNLEDMQGLLNTLESEALDLGFLEYMEQLQERIHGFFFTPGDAQSLYLKDNIQGLIAKRFAAELGALPEGADMRTDDRWVVGTPQFQTRITARHKWLTQVTLEHTAYKRRNLPPSSSSMPSGGSTPSGSAFPGLIYPTGTTFGDVPVYSTGTVRVSPPTQDFFGGAVRQFPLLGTRYGSFYTKAKGETVFEIDWSVDILEDRIENAHIDDIRLVRSEWYST